VWLTYQSFAKEVYKRGVPPAARQPSLKPRRPWSAVLTRAFVRTPPGTRTQNLRIKSPLLCQLS
jgi:hypothetical protein